jgi:hypothetical protein
LKGRRSLQVHSATRPQFLSYLFFQYRSSSYRRKIRNNFDEFNEEVSDLDKNFQHKLVHLIRRMEAIISPPLELDNFGPDHDIYDYVQEIQLALDRKQK